MSGKKKRKGGRPFKFILNQGPANLAANCALSECVCLSNGWPTYLCHRNGSRTYCALLRNTACGGYIGWLGPERIEEAA